MTNHFELLFFRSVLSHIASKHLASSANLDGQNENSQQGHTQSIYVPQSNNSLVSIAKGMINAHNYYCEHISPKQQSTEVNNGQPRSTIANTKKCIVFVVSGDEKNRIDQMKLKDQITISR